MGTFARALFVCVVISFCAAPFASAAILTSNDILRVRFTTSPGSSPVPDTMDLHLGIVQVLQAHTSRTGALFDGNTLLGSGTSTSFGGHVGALSLQPARSWRSPTSLYTFENPAVADFTTIQNGTIDGRIDFTIQTGAMDINLANVRVSMGRATGPSSQLLSNPQPVLTSVEIIPIPEPAMGVVALAALPALLRRRRAA
jgi:hypothetical protein